jgi:cysteine desulfurase
MDYSATTPIDPRVADKMIPYLREQFGNPASRSHMYGWTAEKAVEEARPRGCAGQCRPARNHLDLRRHRIEQPGHQGRGAVLQDQGQAHHHRQDRAQSGAGHGARTGTQGFEATYLEPQDNGLITIEQLTAAIRPDTILVSVMLVNNEIGVIQPIDEIGALCRSKGIIFHCDAAQATGKVAIDLQKTKVDLMTFTAHKTYGPKGIGALYVCRKPRVRIEAQMHGGGHERGLRSGTLPTHQIVGMGEAFRLAKVEMDARSCASRRCATAWPRACRKSKKPTSTATWNTACRTT